MTQLFGSLMPKREMQMQLRTYGFGLAQLWLLEACGVWARGMESLFLCLSLNSFSQCCAAPLKNIYEIKYNENSFPENEWGVFTWQASTLPSRNPAHSIPGVMTPPYAFALLHILVSIIFTNPFWSTLGLAPKGRNVYSFYWS